MRICEENEQEEQKLPVKAIAGNLYRYDGSNPMHGDVFLCTYNPRHLGTRMLVSVRDGAIWSSESPFGHKSATDFTDVTHEYCLKRCWRELRRQG